MGAGSWPGSSIPARQITAIIGPSGCGQSTLLRSLNRMNDVTPHIRIEGEVDLDGRNIYAPEMMRSDRAGELIEFDATETIFTRPRDRRTEDDVTGRFG